MRSNHAGGHFMAIKKKLRLPRVSSQLPPILRRKWVMKGRELLMQNPILARLGLPRPVQDRLAGLQALRALKAQKLRGAELASAFAQLATKLGFLRDESEVNHFQNDWLGSWFPQSPTAEIFLEGFLKAAEVALAQPENALPIQAYWAASQNALVSAAVARSPHQVTLLIMTPTPATRTKVRTLNKLDPIWTVSGTRQVVVKQSFMTGLALGPSVARRAGQDGRKAAPAKRKSVKNKKGRG
jgi:hypothetical protein